MYFLYTASKTHLEEANHNFFLFVINSRCVVLLGTFFQKTIDEEKKIINTFKQNAFNMNIIIYTLCLVLFSIKKRSEYCQIDRFKSTRKSFWMWYQLSLHGYNLLNLKWVFFVCVCELLTFDDLLITLSTFSVWFIS